MAVGIGYGVLHRGRVTGEAFVRRKGDFAGGGVNRPRAFAGDGQAGDRLAVGADQFDALRIDGVVALRVGVVGEDVNGDRLAFGAFGGISVGNRRVVARLRLRVRIGVRIRRGDHVIRCG